MLGDLEDARDADADADADADEEEEDEEEEEEEDNEDDGTPAPTVESYAEGPGDPVTAIAAAASIAIWDGEMAPLRPPDAPPLAAPPPRGETDRRGV
jgi:hypothetical protein